MDDFIVILVDAPLYHSIATAGDNAKEGRVLASETIMLIQM
jgi:hypothetical protein